MVGLARVVIPPAVAFPIVISDVFVEPTPLIFVVPVIEFVAVELPIVRFAPASELRTTVPFICVCEIDIILYYITY